VLHPNQFALLHRWLASPMRRLNRLLARLDGLGVHPDDPYRRRVIAAQDALHRLLVETHYRSCQRGVARDAQMDSRHA
jgi:hypothetical protein